MHDKAIPRDFFARPEDEQTLFIEQTWCDHCQQTDLGMVDPFEYELFGIVFIEGKCKQCGEPVLTELTDDEF